MSYKLIKEHPNSFEIKHPDGSSFHVAKKGVGPGVIKGIKALKLADGGEVAHYADGTPDAGADDEEATPATDVTLPDAPTPDSEYTDVNLSQPGQAPTVSRNPSQAAMEYSPQSVMQNLQAGQKGIEAQYAAQSAGAAQAATEYQRQAAAEQKVMQDSQAHLQSLDAENGELFHSLMNGKIDPNRLISDSSTGAKIGAALSVLLGGAAQGLAGGPNMAVQTINNAITRDVEAQKMELGKKENLLSENLRKYGNMQAATQATMMQMHVIGAAKLAQIASTAQSAEAKGAAQYMGAQFGNQVLGLARDLSVYKAKAQSMGMGGGDERGPGATGTPQEGGLPVGQEPPALLMDPKYTNRRVIVNNRAYQHTSDDKSAVQDMRNVETVAGGVQSLVKQLDQLGPTALVPGTEENNKANAIKAQLYTTIPQLKSMQIGAKRINETEADNALKMIKDPTSFRQAMAGGVKNEEFFKTLSEELENERAQNLLGYKGINRFNLSAPLQTK